MESGHPAERPDNAVKLARETDSASPLAALADQLMRLHATRKTWPGGRSSGLVCL